MQKFVEHETEINAHNQRNVAKSSICFFLNLTFFCQYNFCDWINLSATRLPNSSFPLLSIHADRCFMSRKNRYFQTQRISKLKDLLLFLKVLQLSINFNFILRSLTNLKVTDVEILPLLFIKLLFYCYGNIEISLGPKQFSLTFCHWNLNGIDAHYFVEISFILGYITERNIAIMCLSQTLLNSSPNNKDDGLKLKVTIWYDQISLVV